MRRQARWPGWVWLGVAVVKFGFFVAGGSVYHIASQALTPLLIVVSLAIFFVANRQAEWDILRFAANTITRDDSRVRYSHALGYVLGAARGGGLYRNHDSGCPRD